AAALGRHELILVEPAAAAAQPGYDGFAENRRALRIPHITDGTRGCHEAISAAGDEIARHGRERVIGTNRLAGRPRQGDAQAGPLALRVNLEAADRQDLRRPGRA